MKRKNLLKIVFLCSILFVSGVFAKQVFASQSKSKKTLTITVNGYDVTLSKEGIFNSQNVKQLNSTNQNSITIKNSKSVNSVKIDDKEINVNDKSTFKLKEISSSSKIKISVMYSGENSYRNYYINSLSKDFPKYTVTANSPYDGDYYLTTHNEEYNFVFKLNNKGNIVFYKEVESNPFDFKKITTDDGKVRYGYLLQDKDSTKRISSVGYSPTYLVILDENYNEINKITMEKNKNIESGTELENHDFIYINDNHYIVSSYQKSKATNIPSNLNKGNSPYVVNSVLQEIKDGKVVWQWESIDHEKLYEESVEQNNFSEKSDTSLDYVHFNSMTIDPKDGNLICSFRNLDEVIKLDRKTGEIIWTLGGLGDEFNLTDNQKFSRQHNARITDDGYITLYDNGVKNKSTRVIKIKLDEENKKVTEYRSYDINDYYKYMGSVQEIDSEKDVFLVGTGGKAGEKQDLVAMEKDFSNDKVYFRFSFKSGESMYRCYKIQ
ncbi:MULTISPECIES: arylsulfotransferase family protein [unclassified Clostridioides]|uniref:arylsulfotransferase family protein n=1 Tax=unclassified Clostridioides TaxID=2635829 RepID=UPI001D0FC405|nr:aryl-sulfate sulfotransferase [Clostridioides sp. ES-S-0001-02]MCC0639038.1 aryl-sulfate sulfotransferase [Clostridioides sp. ES-S-0049-03]MCC0675428.1 aryl-sulfate sulfotransferase [Clostridioides sp. ES-W-0018-02]MCC0709763.1 aryl-sulfate sulfotransferase [Clostridioides sp. ES-W-0017-02]UDN59746.1 aryl-sulfate sulfotransferase [Clostridioides sp. ES-S-0010-02]UDN60729.1 aryl-sulfate sulfotransferase [Clostridioides sp. ES-W-0016-02]